MTAKTSPQHRADFDPTDDQAAEEYDAQNWQRMNGTMLPRGGRYRQPSIMAAPAVKAEIEEDGEFESEAEAA